MSTTAIKFPKLDWSSNADENSQPEISEEIYKLLKEDLDAITNKKAILPANEFEKMDKSVLEELELERDILWYASENGLSYEEGCELIEKAKNLLERDTGKK